MNKYPVWRYLLIVVLIVLGVIYALPNLYGEDPAIQVIPPSTINLPADIEQKIAAGLKQQKIPYSSIEREKTSVLIRFHDTETQLNARDVVQAVVGNNYSVALNLAPRTPDWLQSLGALPMKLGLDLRGGIHFLLRIDMDAVIAKREQSDMNSFALQLRQARIRYAGISRDKTSVTIRFRTVENRDAGQQRLSKEYPDYKFEPSKKGNSYILTVSVPPATVIKWQQAAIARTLTILRNRINELGVAEPVIQQQGKNHISVDLPGIQDTARAKALIGKVASVRFQLVDVNHDAATAARSGVVPFGDTLFRYEGRPYLLKNQVILSGTSIFNANATFGEDGRPAVGIQAGGPEVPQFHKITAANVGKPLASVYAETKTIKKIVNGKLVIKNRQEERIISVANINSALGDRFQIMGLDSMRYAQDLALQLRSGAYPAPVAFVQERTVGPSLGKQNIRQGVLSAEVGSLFVFLFMAFYYRLFGLVADMALVLNVVFVVAIMSAIGATMTLPGIAALVLTVGMAVDANVLINERIREELRNGISPQAAIHSGYERAFTTIVDSNVTTLIVAVVLFALGTGPVQGFAITLIIGLLTSMVTAIFFTRGVVNLVYGQRQVKHLSIGIQ